MFGLFKKKVYNNYVLLNYDYEWRISNNFLKSLIENLLSQEIIVTNYVFDDYKYKTFRGNINKIESIDAEKIVSITFFNGEQSGESNIRISVHLGKPKGFNCIFLEILEIIPFDFEAFLISNLFINFKLGYGFFYKVKGTYSHNYLIGVHENTGSLVDIARTSKKHYDDWRQNHNKIVNGYLRDIYSINLLNETQISFISINKVSLDNLIVENPRYGELKKIHGNYLWIIDEKDLQWVRNQCYSEKFIL